MSEDVGYNLNSVMNCMILSKSFKILSISFLTKVGVRINLYYPFQLKKKVFFYVYNSKPLSQELKVDSTCLRKATQPPLGQQCLEKLHHRGFLMFLLI